MIKSKAEIEIMREGGKILNEILKTLVDFTKAGIATIELEHLSNKLFKKYNVIPSFKGYQGYPATICASVNEEVVHSIPGKRILKDGDIINIDAGVYFNNFHVDAARIATIGKISPEVEKFINTAKKALSEAINIIKPGVKTGDIGYIIQKIVEDNGYSIIRELTGHGIGRSLHEKPEILNYGKKNTGTSLIPGMTIAIEPIISMGERYIKTLDTHWDLVTKDNSLATQVEHTVYINKTSVEILV